MNGEKWFMLEGKDVYTIVQNVLFLCFWKSVMFTKPVFI